MAREADLGQRERTLETQVKQQVNQRLAEGRKQIAEEAVKVEAEKTRHLHARLDAAEKQLQEHENKESDLTRREIELTSKERTIGLEVNKRVAEAQQRIWDEATKTVQENQALELHERDRQLHEKDHVIASLKKDLEEAQRKAAQSSAQLRGELEEEDLEAELKRLFPQDEIRPIPRGRQGADVLQVVHNRSGRTCGAILWESKDTKAWSDEWLPKLREDQRNVTADLAVLVSHTLPTEITTFSSRDGVLITRREYVAGIAELLRGSLIRIAHTRTTEEQKEQKAVELYQYVTSTEFIQKIQGIVDCQMQLHKQLERERAAHESMWSRRLKLQTLIIKRVAQLYGDVSALAGELPHIKELELPPPEEQPELLELEEAEASVEAEEPEQPPF